MLQAKLTAIQTISTDTKITSSWKNDWLVDIISRLINFENEYSKLIKQGTILIGQTYNLEYAVLWEFYLNNLTITEISDKFGLSRRYIYKVHNSAIQKIICHDRAIQKLI